MSGSEELYLSGCLFGSEERACLGIEFQAAQGAPCTERIRLYYSADHDAAFSEKFLLAVARALQPLVVAGGQAVCIRHERENLRVIGSVIPRHSDGLNLGV